MYVCMRIVCICIYNMRTHMCALVCVRLFIHLFQLSGLYCSPWGPGRPREDQFVCEDVFLCPDRRATVKLPERTTATSGASITEAVQKQAGPAGQEQPNMVKHGLETITTSIIKGLLATTPRLNALIATQKQASK